MQTGITHKVPTTCNLGLTVSNTMTSDEVHTGIIRSNSYIGNGNSMVQLLGTTEGSIACFGDANGISSIAARI